MNTRGIKIERIDWMMMDLARAAYRLYNWETWDWRLKYIPLIPHWIWYSFRSGSVWFFTPSNPSLVFGGFDGVSKKDMYGHLPEGSYPRSLFVSPADDFRDVEGKVITENFHYPIIAKPEVGRMGLMFRKLYSAHDLKRYHQRMPVNYIIQEYIDFPIEVSVFYYRYPNQPNGSITGFIRKEPLSVLGNGTSTLLELIRSDKRARFLQNELVQKHKEKLLDIVPAGEKFCLSHALNLSRGGKLVSLEHEKDSQLLKVFDDLCHHSKQFYYGRYDIKCASIEDLKAGKNFIILEYNGSGGEPHHVYGNGNSLAKACMILAKHWDICFKISRQNNKMGHRYWNFFEGWRFFRTANKHVQQLKALDSVYPAN